jgi:hypothetical protein
MYIISATGEAEAGGSQLEASLMKIIRLYLRNKKGSSSRALA